MLKSVGVAQERQQEKLGMRLTARLRSHSFSQRGIDTGAMILSKGIHKGPGGLSREKDVGVGGLSRGIDTGLGVLSR